MKGRGIMMGQISIDDLLREKETPSKVVIPSSGPGEKVYRIPEDVWETRCSLCVHKHAQENIEVPLWAVHKPQYSGIIPCRIMTISRPNERPGECMSFTPRIDCYGICETCEHDNIFSEGFCMKKDHAEQHRVFYGMDYGGDERKIDYYSRHRFCVCADYEPNKYARRNRP